MKRLLLPLALLIAAALPLRAEITLDYCLQKARDNYPLIKKYALVEQTADLTLSDINRSWLPRVGVYAQATVQNVVPAFPDALQGMIDKMGQEVRGIGKLQYKAGVDISQTIWEGGSSAARRRIAEAGRAESQAALDVQLYAVREKVESLYFGILLLNEQIARTEATVRLLEANHARLTAMVTNGTALPSDADIVEAQLLTTSQQLTEARSAAGSYLALLSMYVGESLDGQTLARPEAVVPEGPASDRPELRLFDARLNANSARERSVKASLMPVVGFFAQASYGYPGLNYFESMLNRNLSFNILAGLRISWNIDSFYTRRNSLRRISVNAADIEADRDLFLFNSSLQARSQYESIASLRKVIADDERIVALRRSVREASESQLSNGVVNSTALLDKITDELHAQLSSSYHEIQLLQTIYQLKYTLNR